MDVLVSRGYLKILLNPQLETINGRKATVTIRDYAPIEQVRTGSAGASSVYNITTYVWVENTLTVLLKHEADIVRAKRALARHGTNGGRNKSKWDDFDPDDLGGYRFLKRR